MTTEQTEVKPLDEAIAETMSNDFVTVFFRPLPDGFICEIQDARVTWAGWGKTIRAAFDAARSRTISK